jgi:hypothetical protein
MEDYILHALIVAMLVVSIGIISYYIYLLLVGCKQCTSDRNEELPCPNTCNPGYECQPSEPEANIVIGDIVQEEFASESMDEAVPQKDVPEETVGEAAVAEETVPEEES